MNTATGLPDSPSPAIDPSSPDWEHIQRDIRCPLCEYNLRGLIESRCPECGRYFQKLWTVAPTQAAFLIPSTNTVPSIRSCSFALPFNFLQVFCAFRASLNAIAR